MKVSGTELDGGATNNRTQSAVGPESHIRIAQATGGTTSEYVQC
jgi:hypothetical protein